MPDFPSVCSLMMNYYIYYGMREADGTLFIKQHLAVGPAYNVTVILAWLNENVFKNRKPQRDWWHHRRSCVPRWWSNLTKNIVQSLEISYHVPLVKADFNGTFRLLTVRRISPTDWPWKSKDFNCDWPRLHHWRLWSLSWCHPKPKVACEKKQCRMLVDKGLRSFEFCDFSPTVSQWQRETAFSQAR